MEDRPDHSSKRARCALDAANQDSQVAQASTNSKKRRLSDDDLDLPVAKKIVSDLEVSCRCSFDFKSLGYMFVQV